MGTLLRPRELSTLFVTQPETARVPPFRLSTDRIPSSAAAAPRQGHHAAVADGHDGLVLIRRQPLIHAPSPSGTLIAPGKCPRAKTSGGHVHDAQGLARLESLRSASSSRVACSFAVVNHLLK